MLNKIRGSSLPALLTVLILASAAGLTGITNGLPSAERLKAVFQNDKQLQESIADMLTARETYYNKVEAMHQTGAMYRGPVLPENTSPDTVSAEFPSRDVRGLLRSFLLASYVGDENIAGSIISRMHPKRFDFNPKTIIYGGTYIYTLCLMLGAASVARLLPMSPDMAHFLLHPETVAGLFITFRILSVISLIASAALLFWMVKKFYDTRTGLISSVLCILSPTVIYHSHIAKPHLYAMFWVILAFYFAARLLEGGEKRYYILSGIASGLALGVLFPNGLIFSTVIFAEYLRERNVLKLFNRKMLLSALCMAAAFIATNPYVVFSNILADTLISANKTFAYGSVHSSGMSETLHVLFSGAVSWTYIPLLILGAVAVLRAPSGPGRLLLYTAGAFILTHILFLRHAGTFCSAVPFISALCALAVSRPLSQGRLVKTAGAAGLAFVLLVTGWSSFRSLRAFSGKPRLLAAGEWINANIPLNSSIGLTTGEHIRPAVSPYMHFLDYKIYRVNLALAPRKKDHMPEYLTVSEVSVKPPPPLTEGFSKLYSLEKEFTSRRYLMDEITNNHLYYGPQTDVYIYRLREKNPSAG